MKPGLDILKFLAILAVVIIHALSRFWQVSLTTIVIDQACRFSVPLFVALSGYGLSVGYKSVDLGSYFRKRVTRLLPAYLFFVTLTIFAVTYIFHENAALYGNLPLWKLYVLGRADIHLYFIPMIMQLYLLFPLLQVLFKKTRPVIIVLLAFAWQVIWYFLIAQKTEITTDNNSLWPDYQQYVYFTSWIFYFVLGMYLAGRRQLVKFGFIFAVIGLGWSIISSLNLIDHGINSIIAQRFTRLPVLLYATGVIIVGCNLISLVPNIKTLVRLGKASYIIYLGHVLVIRLIDYVLK